MNDSNNKPIALHDVLLRQALHTDGKCVDKRTVKVIAVYKDAITVRPVTNSNGAKTHANARVFRISDTSKLGWIVHNGFVGYHSKPQNKPLNHGIGGYRQGCRCEVCKNAEHAYQREYRAKKNKIGA